MHGDIFTVIILFVSLDAQFTTQSKRQTRLNGSSPRPGSTGGGLSTGSEFNASFNRLDAELNTIDIV